MILICRIATQGILSFHLLFHNSNVNFILANLFFLWNMINKDIFPQQGKNFLLVFFENCILGQILAKRVSRCIGNALRFKFDMFWTIRCLVEVSSLLFAKGWSLRQADNLKSNDDAKMLKSEDKIDGTLWVPCATLFGTFQIPQFKNTNIKPGVILLFPKMF